MISSILLSLRVLYTAFFTLSAIMGFVLYNLLEKAIVTVNSESIVLSNIKNINLSYSTSVSLCFLTASILIFSLKVIKILRINKSMEDITHSITLLMVSSNLLSSIITIGRGVAEGYSKGVDLLYSSDFISIERLWNKAELLEKSLKFSKKNNLLFTNEEVALLIENKDSLSECASCLKGVNEKIKNLSLFSTKEEVIYNHPNDQTYVIIGTVIALVVVGIATFYFWNKFSSIDSKIANVNNRVDDHSTAILNNFNAVRGVEDSVDALEQSSNQAVNVITNQLATDIATVRSEFAAEARRLSVAISEDNTDTIRQASKYVLNAVKASYTKSVTYSSDSIKGLYGEILNLRGELNNHVQGCESLDHIANSIKELTKICYSEKIIKNSDLQDLVNCAPTVFDEEFVRDYEFIVSSF